jgi:hypothetical protein
MGVKVSLALVLCSWLAIAGCEKSANQMANMAQPASNQAVTTVGASNIENAGQAQKQTAPGKDTIDACPLITPDELKSVQGEAPTESKTSTRVDSTFVIAQCIYLMPTYSKSVSLEVTRSSSEHPQPTVRQFWKERFQETTEKEEGGREREREKERDSDRKERESEAEGPKPLKVTGIGDDAFWTGNTRAGALYVLKGDAILRLSVGGPENVNEKIRKLRILAQNVLSRLK